jgi:hypothetical protein
MNGRMTAASEGPQDACHTLGHGRRPRSARSIKFPAEMRTEPPRLHCTALRCAPPGRAASEGRAPPDNSRSVVGDRHMTHPLVHTSLRMQSAGHHRGCIWHCAPASIAHYACFTASRRTAGPRRTLFVI